jgi:hypothetical protein
MVHGNHYQLWLSTLTHDVELLRLMMRTNAGSCWHRHG